MRGITAHKHNSIVGPAILHTNSNAPVTALAMPDDALAVALVPHMAVVLVSLYLVFGLGRLFVPEAAPVSGDVWDEVERVNRASFES